MGVYRGSGTGLWIKFLVVLVLAVAWLPVATAPSKQAMLTLDGVGTSNCQRPFCVHSQLLTTVSGNDVIVLVVETYCNTGISHITDSSGLNFTLSVSHANGCYGTLWEYYAISTAGLNQDNITVLADQCCSTIMGMQVLAVHEANTLGVFDPDPSTPAAVSCPGEGCGDCTANFGKGTCSVSIRTSTLDFVIASTAINGAPACGPHYQTGQVQGFTSLMPNQNGRFEVDYAITSLPQTTVVFACNGTDASVILVDAISSHGAFDR